MNGVVTVNKIIIGTNIGLKEILLSNINAIDKKYLMGMKVIGWKTSMWKILGILMILICLNGSNNIYNLLRNKIYRENL